MRGSRARRVQPAVVRLCAEGRSRAVHLCSKRAPSPRRQTKGFISLIPCTFPPHGLNFLAKKSQGFRGSTSTGLKWTVEWFLGRRRLGIILTLWRTINGSKKGTNKDLNLYLALFSLWWIWHRALWSQEQEPRRVTTHGSELDRMKTRFALGH